MNNFRKIKRFVCIMVLVCVVFYTPVSYAASGNTFIFYLNDGSPQATVCKSLAKVTQSYLKSVGYTCEASVLPTVKNALSKMSTGKVVIFACHGNSSSVKLSDGSLSSETVASQNFNNCKLVYFNCCQVAKTNSAGKNLCNAVYNAGASCVIGFKEDIIASNSKTFTTYFFKQATEQGANMGACMSYAKSKTYSQMQDVQSAILFGNSYTTII